MDNIEFKETELIDTATLSEDIDIPFSCYPCNENDIYNEQPETYTHVLIPKQNDLLLYYPKLPIDTPIQIVKNKTIKNILFTLECEGIRKIQNKELLEEFCKERTKEAFNELNLSDLNEFCVSKEDENILNEKNIKCYTCLNNFNMGDIIVAHPSTENITLHKHCFLCAMV